MGQEMMIAQVTVLVIVVELIPFLSFGASPSYPFPDQHPFHVVQLLVGNDDGLHLHLHPILLIFSPVSEFHHQNVRLRVRSRMLFHSFSAQFPPLTLSLDVRVEGGSQGERSVWPWCRWRIGTQDERRLLGWQTSPLLQHW